LHFTGLKIVGFKSFADPVDFEIHSGLTGIVGPNGCGKSNILEALRWVMGATSARAMRGGEMDDLIFSGSSNRPSRENAEVALILDNSLRQAPLELNDSDEIEVRRRLRRGAGSTYKINGRTVRAKDVQLLFADASTGANSPSLVRQGQISELISSKPQNRRRILEEAAGIAGLNQRRHDAELKLRAASESLSRLDEIIGEVEKQLNTLKRQAARAQKYKAIQEEIDLLEIHVALIRWQDAKDDADEANIELENANSALSDASRLETRATTEETHKRAAIPELRDHSAEASGMLGALKLQIAQLDTERQTASSTIVQLEKDQSRIIADLEREHGLREEATKAAEAARSSLKTLPKNPDLKKSVAYADLQKSLEKVQDRLKLAETEHTAQSNQLAVSIANAADCKQRIERADQKAKELEIAKEKASESLKSLGDEVRKASS